MPHKMRDSQPHAKARTAVSRLNGVDPEAYLVDVLERMVSGATKNNQLHELLVWNWKAAREAERRAAA